jgi:predicted RNase H-like HicB family nuclease
VRRYLIIIERGNESYSAYSPDLPGCIATGKTLRETRSRMQGAMELHVEGLRAEGLPVPPAQTLSAYVQISG